MQYATPHTRIPFGYRRDPLGKASVPVPDETVADSIYLLFAYAAAARHNLYEISTRLADEGFVTRAGEPYSVHFLQRILRDPFYAGYVERDGRLIRGGHEAIVDKPTFHLVRYALGPEPRPSQTLVTFGWFCLWVFTRAKNLG